VVIFGFGGVIVFGADNVPRERGEWLERPARTHGRVGGYVYGHIIAQMRGGAIV